MAIDRVRAALLGGLLIYSGACGALDPDRSVTQYVIDQWGPQQGLPHNVVRAVTESSDGYLWVATQSGVARFDGASFTVFNPLNTPALASEDIRDVVQHSSGELWIATYGGGVVRVRDGRFTRFTADDGLGDNIVRCAYEDSRGAVWFCTASGLTRLWDGEFSTYTREHGLLDNLVYNVAEDADGNLWVGVLGGASRLSRDGFTNFRAGKELPAGVSFVFGLARDGRGGMWMGTYGGGLLHYRDGEVRAINGEDGLADDRLLAVARDGDDNLWIATYDKGVQRYRDGEFELLGADIGLHAGIPFDIFEDSRGNIWIGTAGAGLHRLKDGPFVTYGLPEGLADPKVFAVTGEPGGAVWLGTEGGGLHRLEDGGLTVYTAAHGLSNDNIVSLALTEDGSLWAGTFGAGLNRLREGRFESWDQRDGLPGDQVFALEPDGSGGVWVGTINGLARIHNGNVTAYGRGDGLPANDIRALLVDRSGVLWIGTNGGGLSRFDGEGFSNYSRVDGLAGELVYSLYEDDRGVLWIGTKDGGLSRLEDGVLTTMTSSDGLWHDSIYAITEDDAGNLWFSCPKGVFRASRERIEEVMRGSASGLDVRTFDHGDGLREGHTVGGSQPAVWKSPEGRLWFATFAGVSVVDPTAVPDELASPGVVLEQALVDGEPVDPGRAMVLPPGSTNLEFHYTAVELSNADRVRFRYRLLGLEDDWIDAGRRRVAYFTRLPPGDYRFQVAASMNGGAGNASLAELPFTLRPQFHQTQWFLLAAGAALVASGFGLYALRARGIRRRERELSRLVSLRTRELALAKQRFERLSKTDMLTGLPNRRYFEERLKGEWERAGRSERVLAVVLLDIDRFKQFNDTHGHHAGDDCLRQVGAAMQAELARGGDVVARYGGEEFVALLPETDLRGARRVAERIRVAVAELDLSFPDLDWKTGITLSAGVCAIRPGPGADPRELLAAADAAMYRAKALGRNRVEVAPSD